MKVTHSNQTLILASGRRGQGAKPDDTLDQAVNAASKGGTLKRVTIVATQREGDSAAIVYLTADYATRPAAAERAAATLQSPGAAPVAISRSPTLTAAPGGGDVSATATGSQSAGTALSALYRSAAHTSAPDGGNGIATASSRQSAGTALVAISRSPARISASGAGDVSAVVTAHLSIRDLYGNVQSSSRESGLSAYLSPAEQYARTQRISTSTSPQLGLIDVLA